MTPGFDTTQLSADIRPQDDLFGHVNARWLRDVEIPADRASYGAFHMLQDTAEQNLRDILEDAAARAGLADEAEATRQVGDLYASFLDEERVERAGWTPITADLDLVEGVRDRADLLRVLGRLHRTGISGPFQFWVNTDAAASHRYLVYLSQGGLGLPDESYYRGEAFAEIRASYLKHVARMLELAGRPDPQGAASRVMELETALAAAHWDRVTARDAVRSYNRLEWDQLRELTPAVDWAAWLEGLGATPEHLTEVVVRQPDYLSALADLLERIGLEQWREWLIWRVIRARAAFLSSDFVTEEFAFSGTVLTGAAELRVRWKRGVAVVESGLGEALGRLYVERHFPPEARARMVELVADLIEAYRHSITNLDWMSPETKARALDKLDRFTPKIGYPDTWRDFAGLVVDREDLVGNVRRIAAFELDRDLGKLGGPVDRSEWFMTPQTVNAYYNPGLNEIVFPAAILQPPFFDIDADDATNYGAIGAVIGHEIGHGFDDQGSRYDGDGNLTDWWTDADRTEFTLRTERLIAQYSVLEPRQAPGHQVNGALTVGENIGDLGGLSIAYAAYRLATTRDLAEGSAPAPETVGEDGFTGPQRFFLSWARAWRTVVRDTELVRRLTLDPHSPAEFRCNAVVRNVPAFYTAFSLEPGDQLWLDEPDRVAIW